MDITNQNKGKAIILFVNDNPVERVLMEWLVKSNVVTPTQLICASDIEGASKVLADNNNNIDILFLDNELHTNHDFRASAAVLRSNAFTGMIGIISSSIEQYAFQEIEQYGVDFRIGKNELDRHALGFIINESINKTNAQEEEL